MATPPDLKTPAAIRQWLTDVMAERGLSTIEWATRAGVARSTLFRALAPDYGFVTSRRTLAKLAAALDAAELDADVTHAVSAGAVPGNGGGQLPSTAVSAAENRAAAGAGLAVATPRVGPVGRSSAYALPLRFEVQHGAWYECLGPDFSIYFEGDVPNFEPDSRFGGARQWLELVRDDSADMQILPLSFAHVVDAGDINYGPRHGDWVVVERARAAGQLTERTIRQVDIRGGDAHLILRSTNPKWVGGGEACVIPVAAAAQPAAASGGGASIAGLVVGAYRRW